MKYGFIINDTIDTVSFNPPRVLVPAMPAVLNEDGSIKTQAVEEHWGNLVDGWILIPDEAFAGYVKQGSAWVAPETAPKPIDDVLADYKYAFDHYLDRVAQAKQYDNRITITTYLESTVDDWVNDARAFITWRDEALDSMFQTLAKVQAGQMEQPSIKEFINSIPPAPWPVEL